MSGPLTPADIEIIADALLDAIDAPLSAFSKRLEKLESREDTGPLLDLIARLEAQVETLSKAINAQEGTSR